jgi:hypothetical protein
MDRSVHPTASEQACVRRVDDCVDVLLGDVATDELDHAGNANALGAAQVIDARLRTGLPNRREGERLRFRPTYLR